MMTFKRAIDGLMSHKKEATKSDGSLSVYREKVDIMARWVPARGQAGHWKSYGDVTHEEAATSHAEFFSRGGMVETKVDGASRIFRIEIERQVVYKARCLRGD